MAKVRSLTLQFVLTEEEQRKIRRKILYRVEIQSSRVNLTSGTTSVKTLFNMESNEI